MIGLRHRFHLVWLQFVFNLTEDAHMMTYSRCMHDDIEVKMKFRCMSVLSNIEKL